MVEVASKEVTLREAVAEAVVRVSTDADRALRRGTLPKGGAREVVRIAAIQAAKLTAQLLPLCHPLRLTRIDADLTPAGRGRWRIVTRVTALDRTGVEMEALTAASVGALALYDMVKAVDRAATIERVALISKSGGKSGDYVRARTAGAGQPSPRHRVARK